MTDAYKKVNVFLDTNKTAEGFQKFVASLSHEELKQLLCTQDGIGKERKEVLFDYIWDWDR